MKGKDPSQPAQSIRDKKSSITPSKVSKKELDLTQIEQELGGDLESQRVRQEELFAEAESMKMKSQKKASQGSLPQADDVLAEGGQQND